MSNGKEFNFYEVSGEGQRLLAVEHHGEIPKWMKKDANRRGIRMVSPRMSTNEGKAAKEKWKTFGSGDWRKPLELLGIPSFELSGLTVWHPSIEVFLNNKVFVITMKEYTHPDLKPIKRWEFEKAADENKNERLDGTTTTT